MQTIDFDGGLGRAAQCSLGLFTGGPQASQGFLIFAHVFVVVLALEFVTKIFDQIVVEIFAAQMRVAIRGLDLE